MGHKGTCCVVNQHCTAAANFEEPSRVATCFSCGLDVCTSCSSRRTYRTYGRQRLCDNCQVEEDGHARNVMYRIAKMAGYDHAASKAIAKEY